MKAILTLYNSRRDVYGNCYYAVEACTEKGKSARGTISAPNIDTRDCRENLKWWVTQQELPIREFTRFTRGMEHIGCTWEDIKANLLKQLRRRKHAMPTV